jgi:hypothetical protein
MKRWTRKDRILFSSYKYSFAKSSTTFVLSIFGLYIPGWAATCSSKLILKLNLVHLVCFELFPSYHNHSIISHDSKISSMVTKDIYTSSGKDDPASQFF